MLLSILVKFLIDVVGIEGEIRTMKVIFQQLGMQDGEGMVNDSGNKFSFLETRLYESFTIYN